MDIIILVLPLVVKIAKKPLAKISSEKLWQKGQLYLMRMHAARVGGAYQFLLLYRLFVYETQFRKRFSQDFIATFFR